MRFATVRRAFVMVLFGTMLTGAAQAVETPSTLDGTKIASAEEVTKLQSSGAPVFDVRVASEYAEAHIKGAVSVPYREKSEKTVGFDEKQDEFGLAKLPTDKATAVIFYCNGPECWKSYKASILATKAGYTNIYWYRDGFTNWKSKNLPTE